MKEWVYIKIKWKPIIKSKACAHDIDISILELQYSERERNKVAIAKFDKNWKQYLFFFCFYLTDEVFFSEI